MATLPLFQPFSPVKQTQDVDSSRSNLIPALVQDSTGRIAVFYEKDIDSGLQSGGVLSDGGGYLLNVSDGTGSFDSTLVTWDATSFTLPGGSNYYLVTVDTDSTVHYTAESSPAGETIKGFPMALSAQSILLGNVSTTGSEIDRIYSFESGKYIYCRRHTDATAWTDYEYRLNVGESPSAIYDSSAAKFYLSYLRDGNNWVRVFDASTASLSFQEERALEESGGLLYLQPYLDDSTGPLVNSVAYQMAVSLGEVNFGGDRTDFYKLGRSLSLNFKSDGTLYAHLPYITSDYAGYTNYLLGDATLEIYSYSGGEYTLEGETGPLRVDSDSNTGLEFAWTISSDGTRFVGLKTRQAFFSGFFRTDPADYQYIRIPDRTDYTLELSDSSWAGDMYEPQIEYKMALSGEVPGQPNIEKTEEFEQNFKLNDEDIENQIALSGSFVGESVTKTEEFDQLYKLNDEDISYQMALVSGQVELTSETPI